MLDKDMMAIMYNIDVDKIEEFKGDSCNILFYYDGGFPNLCAGRLFVVIDGKAWDFGNNVLSSGGMCVRHGYVDDVLDGLGTGSTEEGAWSVGAWPPGFPFRYMHDVKRAVNWLVQLGCCGGCL